MNAEQVQFQEKLKGIYRSQDKIEPLVEGLESEIPQKSMKDYYIKLQTIVDNNKEKKQAGYAKISNNKQEVEVENIFDKLPGQETSKDSETNKLLILGGAGVGKSTLMRYMAYKWGEGELWRDRFDFVYRVPLKFLLNQDWKIGRYSSDDLDDSELKCLVHYNLTSSMSKKERQECRLNKIVWLDENDSSLNDRILLLLDGYDEVAHLQKDEKLKKEFEEILEEIFGFKNIILTSRPNAITHELAEKFDRKIENSGLGNEGINQYFTRYFQQNEEKGKELSAFLAKNPSIREICNIPVNIAMLCFIWAESESKAALQKVSNISDLYGQVVDHLGYRFYTKQKSESHSDLKSLWQGGKIRLDELKVLQHVAYRGLIGDGLETFDSRRPETLIIKGMIAREDEEGTSVQSSINLLRDGFANKYLTINNVYKYGLLKTEGFSVSENNKKDLSDMDLQAQSFSFIHLSFQEYLTAQYLVEQLVNGKEDRKTLIADFIARHRNEPRYGLLLKFMAGIFRAIPGQKNEDLIKGIKIFWDAIVCNPNGALEFGIDAKVNLLMHLLSQAKDERGQIDSRIPNQELMVKFIDYQMLGGLMRKVYEWKASDYMSANLKKDLLEKVLNEDESWGSAVRQKLEKEFGLRFQINSQDAENDILIEEEPEDLLMTAADELPKTYAEESFDAFSSLINHFNVGEQDEVIQKLLQDVKNYNGEENKVINCKRKIAALTKIFQSRKLNPEDSRAFIEILFTTIFDNTLVDVSLKGIVETVKASSGDLFFKDLVKEGLRNCQIDSKAANLKAHLESMVQLLRIADCGQDSQVMRKLSNLGVSMLNHSNIFVREVASRLIKLTLDEYNAADEIEFAQNILKSLIPLLNNPETPIQIVASEIICKIISSPAGKARIQVLQELARNMISPENDSTDVSAAFPVLEILERHFVISDPQMMQEIIGTLIPQLRTSNISQILIICEALLKTAKIYGSTNPKLTQDVITELIPMLGNSRAEFQLNGLKQILDFALVAQNTEIYFQAIKAFTPLLCDSKKNVRNRALSYTVELFKAKQEIDKSLFFETVNSLVKFLDHSDSSKRNLASKSLLKLVIECEISDVSWIRGVIDSIMPLTKESGDANKIEIAIDTILNLVEMKDSKVSFPIPENKNVWNAQLIQEVIDIFASGLSSTSSQLKPRILVTIAKLEKIGGNNNIIKLKGIIDELNPLLKDPSNDVKKISAKGILDLLKILKDVIDPQLLKNKIEDFILLMRSADRNLQAALIFYITEISQILKDKDVKFLNEIIPILVPYIQDSSLDSEPMQQDAMVGIASLMRSCTIPPNIQLARDTINALFRINKIDHKASEDLNRVRDSIKEVIKIYNNSDKQTRSELIEILISHLDVRNQELLSSGIEELTNNKDSQLFERAHSLLNLHLEKTSEVSLQVLVLELRTEIEMMNNDGNIQRVKDLIAVLRSYLKPGEVFLNHSISGCLTELMKKSADLRDAKLLQDILDIQSFLLENENEYSFNRRSLELMKLARLVQRKDQALLKNIIHLFLVGLRKYYFSPNKKYLEDLYELFGIYGSIEIDFLKDIVEKLTSYFDEMGKQHQSQLGGFLQRLSVYIMPYPEVLGEYLDHLNENLRHNLRTSVFNYFKTYLNRFEVMESLVSKSSINELILEEINKILFDGGLEEAGSEKIGSCLDLLKVSNKDLLDQQLGNFKLLIASELGLVEVRKGIRLVQVAYIAIYRSEFSEYKIEKELSDLSWEILNILVKYLTEENLQWIHDNYDKLEKLAPYVHKSFCIKLYHKMLEDRVITPLEERMITAFLRQGLTTSLTNQGDIVFQDVKYRIEGDDIRNMLERIARVIIRYGQDLLARQYKLNIPLFEKNEKGGMQGAAVDIRKMPSLVEDRIILRSDFWLLTSLKQLNTTSELILLEQRSAFGNRIVFKLEGESFKELSEKVNLQDTFGKYQSGLIYLGKSKRLSPLIGQGLVKNTGTMKFVDVKGPQVGQTSLYYQQELLGGGKEDRMFRALSTKQDNSLHTLESQLETLDLNESEKVALQEYYEGFIATFWSVYAVSQVIDSDMFNIEIEADDKFSPIGLFTTLVALIPFGIGENLSKGIENLALAVKEKKVKNEAKFMIIFAMDAVDLSDRVSKFALQRILTEESRNEILGTKDPDPEGVIAKVEEFVASKIEQLKSKAIQVTKVDNLFAKEIQKSAAYRFGESQANEMIQEWFKFNHAKGDSFDLNLNTRRTEFIQLVTTKKSVQLKAQKNKIPLDGASEGKPGCCGGCQIF